MMGYRFLGRAVLACVLSGPAALAGPLDDDLGSCFAKVDAAFRAARGQSFEDRLAALPHYADSESQCISNMAANCASNSGPVQCYQGMSAYLTEQLPGLYARLPDKIQGTGKLQSNYADWRTLVVKGEAVPPAYPCQLASSFPAEACAVMAVASGFIDARGWQRLITELESLE